MTSTSKTASSGIKRTVIWASVTLVLLAAGGWYYYSRTNPRTQGLTIPQLQPSSSAVVRQGDLILSATGTGTLISQSDATFGFDTTGQVTQVSVKVGDQVEAGQVLAQLDDTLLQMKYDEAQQALQELYSAASIATVEQEVATAKDTEFHARTWLAYLLSPEVVDAQDNLAIAQQKLAEAQANAKANPSDAANQIVDTREKAVAYLHDQLTQAQTYYQDTYLPETFGVYVNVGTRRHRKIVLDTYVDPYTGELLPNINKPSPADIATAQNNYAQAQQTVTDGETYLEVLKTGVIPTGATGSKLTTLYNAQQAVKNAKTALDATQLVAPVSGTVTALDIHLGEQGNTSSAVTISQLAQPYTLDGYIDQSDWNMAQVGNKVNVTFDLLPAQTFAGTVTTVYPGLITSSDSPTVHIQMQLNQTISQTLPAGTGATLDVVGGEAQNALIIPATALQRNNDGTYSVSVIQNGQPTTQPVEVGLQGNTYVEIKSGLRPGEIVATK